MGRQIRIRQAAGISLIELMIALLLGLWLIAAIGTLFTASSRNYREDQARVHLQDELRFALATLLSDLEMAGFWAELLDPAGIALDGSLNDPGCNPVGTARWAYADRSALTALDNATPATVAQVFSCLQPDQIAADTDIVAIKRVTGRPSGAGNGVFLRTNGVVGSLFLGASPQDPTRAVPPPFQDWAYVPSIYFIRRYSVTPGDGVPNLCRLALQGPTPRFVTECLAEGIEDLQLSYGIDTDGDGAADRFLHDATPGELSRVVAVRVALLVRSVDPLQHYHNRKTYRLGNAPARAPADRYYRRAVQATAHIRNPSALRRLLGS